MGEESARCVVLITGASSGIGAASARAFARRGFQVILAARRIEQLEHLADELRSGYPECEALPIQADVSRPDDIRSTVTSGLERFGKIDILFANAGSAALGWLEELDPEREIQDQLRANLEGVVLTAREVLPHMQARRKGHIILMSSLAGWIPTPTYSVYAASKFGVRGFGGALRREVSAWGIQVSTVYVGAVRTGFADEAVRRRKTGWRTPVSMVLSPENVAESIIGLTRHPRATLVLPPYYRLVIWLDFIWPGLLDRLAAKAFVERERVDELSARPAKRQR
jgi:short-subunit dehydrogenase